VLAEQTCRLPPSTVATRIATAYMASQAVNAACELRIPDILGSGAATAGEVAQATGAQSDMMRRLLRALAAFDVLKDLGTGQFELTPVGRCLRADVPNSVRPIVALFGSEAFCQQFASLAKCVETGQNAYQLLHGLDCSFAYYEQHPEFAAVFDEAMSAVSAFTGPAIADAYDFAGISHVIDIGGGHGKVLASILKAHPHLRGTLFDVPRVAAAALSSLAREGVADRCQALGGDMLTSVPAGGDLYLLCHVIHDWDDEHATRVLQACSDAMAPRTKLLILDRVMPERIEPNPVVQADVLLDLRMLVGTRGGRERTAAEFGHLLATAGLRLDRIVPTRTPSSLVEASSA
jgi:orsellinic acid C2-O-methyltransferase